MVEAGRSIFLTLRRKDSERKTKGTKEVRSAHRQTIRHRVCGALAFAALQHDTPHLPSAVFLPRVDIRSDQQQNQRDQGDQNSLGSDAAPSGTAAWGR